MLDHTPVLDMFMHLQYGVVEDGEYSKKRIAICENQMMYIMENDYTYLN